MQDISNNNLNANSKIYEILMYVLAVVPFFRLSNILIPLCIWYLKKNDNQSIDFHGKNILNYQIHFSIVVETVRIIAYFTFAPGDIAISLFIPIAYIANFIICLKAAHLTYQGEIYELPRKYTFV